MIKPVLYILYRCIRQEDRTKPPATSSVSAVDNFECDFDTNSVCSMEQTEHHTAEYWWLLNMGRTPSGVTALTGPEADTSSRGYYVYIEASNPVKRGDYAVLVARRRFVVFSLSWLRA